MTENKMMMVADQLERITTDHSLAALGAMGQFKKAFLVAQGISSLRAALSDEVMAPIMELQNTALGFRTDKPEGYPLKLVKEAIIEATIRGLQPVGNQFNIIAGRCYVTKEGFTHLMKTLPGLTDLKLFPGVPSMSQGGAIVKYRATWKYNGQDDNIDRELPIRLNSGMGADGALGKAERKIRAAIYGQITCTTMSDGQADDDSDAIPITRANGKGKTTEAAHADSMTDRLAAIKKVRALTPQRLARAKGKLNISPEPEKMTVEQCNLVLEAAANEPQ